MVASAASKVEQGQAVIQKPTNNAVSPSVIQRQSHSYNTYNYPSTLSDVHCMHTKSLSSLIYMIFLTAFMEGETN